MKVIDKFRRMSVDELANWYSGNVDCSNCQCRHKCHTDDVGACVTLLKAWLNEEYNPLPEIQRGDFIFTQRDIYVVVSDGLMVNLESNKIMKLNLIDVQSIKRFDGDVLKKIWKYEYEK